MSYTTKAQKELRMKSYYEYLDDGLSLEEIRALCHEDLELLGKYGGFYTMKEFMAYTKLTAYSSLRFFQTCYDKNEVTKRLSAYVLENPDANLVDMTDFLNEKKYFTITGKYWTVATLRNLLASTKISATQRKSLTRSRHFDLWVEFDKHRENFLSYNNAIIFLTKLGIRQESGRKLSRQHLDLIMKANPDLDWSLPNRYVRKEIVAEDKYIHLTKEYALQKYTSFDDMVKGEGIKLDFAVETLLRSRGLSRTSWLKEEKSSINQAIQDILAKNNKISYGVLWNKLVELGLVNKVSQPVQRMYNYMTEQGLTHLKQPLKGGKPSVLRILSEIDEYSTLIKYQRKIYLVKQSWNDVQKQWETGIYDANTSGRILVLTTMMFPVEKKAVVDQFLYYLGLRIRGTQI